MTGAKEIEAVADGLATLGVQLISEILPIKGVDLVGPLPGDLQNSTELKIAVSAESKSADLARQFVAYTTSNVAADVIRAKGMIPPQRKGACIGSMRTAALRPASYVHLCSCTVAGPHRALYPCWVFK